MKKSLRRILSTALAAVLMSGMCLTASAFTYPSSYWPLHNQWEAISGGSDTDAILAVAQQTYDLLMPLGLSQDVCWNLEPKCAKASWICENKGDLDGAITWLERQLSFAQWLHDNGYGYDDTLLDGNARLEYLRAAKTPKIYAQSDTDPSPYRVGPATGTWYGTALGHEQPGESAVLMYVDFQDGHSVEYWIDYYLGTSDNFRQAADGGVIELAWNFSPEGTAGCQKVLSAGSYISEGVRAMGELDATILLRPGAEMNNWSDCDPATYIQAYRKIADAARQYSNIQMVFSPDNISNRNRTIADFYPGDQYVDWVGMSTYQNSNYNDLNGNPQSYTLSAAPGSNAYYGTGLYDYDPMMVIKPIIDLAKAHNKPVMVSECGFAYRNNYTGADQTSYALEQMTKFYSYINMVYPQVKAVFYFDATLSGGQYSYALNGNSSVAANYRSVVEDNGAFLAQGQRSAVNWEELSQTRLTGADPLRLAAYVSFPGVKSATVEYYVDGQLVHTSSQVPYYYELDTAALGGGEHKIHVVATGNQFRQQSAAYTLTVPGAAQPEPEPEPSGTGFTDVAGDAWYADSVAWAVENGITAGTTPTTFGPDDTCTRSQIITFLYAAAGKPAGAGENPFGDVKQGDWFYDATAWAAANGVEDGDSFAPGAPCTRAMAMEFIWRALGCPEAAVSDNPFTDVAQDAVYRDAVLWALGEGVTSGVSDTTFGSDNTCTRSQIVTFLYQAFA